MQKRIRVVDMVVHSFNSSAFPKTEAEARESQILSQPKLYRDTLPQKSKINKGDSRPMKQYRRPRNKFLQLQPFNF
jgi:hypothetical protein